MKKSYVATVQIEIEAESEADATDGIGNLLGEARDFGKIAEWQYAQFGRQWLYPSEGMLPREES